MARPAGFEPTTPWFVAKYSIQLSYGRAEPLMLALDKLPERFIACQPTNPDASCQDLNLMGDSSRAHDASKR